MNTYAEKHTWKSLYRVGGTAPLVALIFYITQMVVIILGKTYPITIHDWYSLFARNKLLGLIYINALDMFSITFLGTMFLALYVALSHCNPSLMAIAAFFAFLGIAVFVSSRATMVSAILSLSEQYAAATTEGQRSQLLAAGQAIHAPIRATTETTGFLFMAVAGLLISIVSLRNEVFGKGVAYLGILASTATFADDVSLIFVPPLAAILMPINSLLWLVWWLLISHNLFKESRRM
ncbi:MAG: DUF4386 family protein [Anaerolineae bacterium]|nr:DUF4386 family protein [Anaerolineae bacterium]